MGSLAELDRDERQSPMTSSRTDRGLKGNKKRHIGEETHPEQTGRRKIINKKKKQ